MSEREIGTVVRNDGNTFVLQVGDKWCTLKLAAGDIFPYPVGSKFLLERDATDSEWLMGELVN